MKSFKEFIVEEGNIFTAIKHGIKVGTQAFKKKLSEPNNDKISELNQKLFKANGKELDQLIRQIVDNGYTFRAGKVANKSNFKKSTDWLLEHVSTLFRNSSQKSREKRP